MRTKQPDPHRNRGNPETGSHFLCGKLHHIAEKAYVTQFRRQLGDRIGKDAQLFPTPERRLGTLAPTARACLIRRGVLAFVERQGSIDSFAAKEINRAIRGDSHKPGTELVGFHFRSRKLVEFAESFQQRLLANVFGVLGACRETASQSLEPRGVRRNERAESLVVAGARRGQWHSNAARFAGQLC